MGGTVCRLPHVNVPMKGAEDGAEKVVEEVDDGWYPCEKESRNADGLWSATWTGDEENRPKDTKLGDVYENILPDNIDAFFEEQCSLARDAAGDSCAFTPKEESEKNWKAWSLWEVGAYTASFISLIAAATTVI